MNIVDEKLQSISCPLSCFVLIADGIVGRTRLTQYCKGDVQLDARLVEKINAVLDELVELSRASAIAPNWSDAENIRKELRLRKEFKAVVKYDEDKMRELLNESASR
jgi:hypothetical protein